jgi:hypothetical protein
MRECRTSGSVRGALSNERPYRDYKPQDFGGCRLEKHESRRRSLPLGTDGAPFQAAVCGGALCRLVEDGEAAGCGHGGGWGHAEAPAAGTAWLPLLSAGGEVLPFGELDLHVETLRELPAAVDHADRRAERNTHRRHTVLAEKMRPSK